MVLDATTVPMLMFEPESRAWPFHQYTPKHMRMIVIVGGIESPVTRLFRRRVENVNLVIK